MMKWQIVFCSELALREVQKLPADLQSKFIHIQDLVETHGPFEVGMPYVRPLLEKLWEIRLKGKDTIARSIYIAKKEKKIVILRTFIKKTQRTPSNEVMIALKRLKEMTDDYIL